MRRPDEQPATGGAIEPADKEIKQEVRVRDCVCVCLGVYVRERAYGSEIEHARERARYVSHDSFIFVLWLIHNL